MSNTHVRPKESIAQFHAMGQKRTSLCAFLGAIMQAMESMGLRTSGLIVVWLSLYVISGLASSSTVSAHGASPKKIEEKIDIAARPEVVWGLIGDFANISNWNPAVTSSKAIMDPDQGQERILMLKSGSKITDAQTDYDATKMTYSYRRVDDDVKAFPVSFYSATITVIPTATGSEVDWIGRFYRGDTSNEPPPGLDDQDAINAMTDFFQTGLKNLKALAEKK